jgi:phosphate transport system substrate-binding protein
MMMRGGEVVQGRDVRPARPRTGRRPVPTSLAILAGLACVSIRGAETAAVRSPETAFVDSLPSYAPPVGEKITGTIRVWGHGSFKRDFMGQLMRRWTEGFTRIHPGVTVENKMYGTASAIGALATGAGNLALLGEEISPAAARMFQRAKGYPPTEIDVATGSLDVNFFDYAHMIFVRRDNPITGLTLAQLDGIFGDEHRRGSRNIRTWGELGLTSEWTDQPIQPYSWKIEEDFALFFRAAVLEDSHRWNPATKEFVHVIHPDGTQYDHGQQILDALARDRFGIAISNVRYANAQVKVVPLARREGGPYYEPIKANLISQKYPLTRIIPAFVDQPPGKPIEPAVREFLRYILSREGQQAVVADSAYLPLGDEPIRTQLERLKDSTGVGRSAAAEPRSTTSIEGNGSSNWESLRVWGNVSLAPLVRQWKAGFAKLHPAAPIESKLPGSDVAMAALYTGQADVALLGRDATSNEVKAFEWIFRYQPTRIEVANGSVGVAGHSPALVVFVHRDNPLSRLTLAQLDAIFGAERKRGAAVAIRTWGDVGLEGEWARAPIDLYASDVDTGTGRFFQEAALGDSRKENWSRLREFSGNDAGQKILAALASDRFGIAVANLDAADPRVKPLALATDPKGPFVVATRDSVIARTYPLTRTVVAYVNRKPGTPLDPHVQEFLRYLLSTAGQQKVEREGIYLPLGDAVVRAQRAALE